ncbi:MAG: hypothetical protein OQL06_06440 [Gammaproteobacteria bacterium]|nr:hypothetical protein [Gammaproteobacteria bacterium]
MEFFASVDSRHSVASLQEKLIIENLPRYCASIDTVIENKNYRGLIYCIWGEFAVAREVINGGVRFSLTSCPNSLAWTITTGHEPVPDDTVIHLTISRQQHDFDFIDSIHTFVSDWKQGLEKVF